MKPGNILAVDRDDVGYINSWSITVARYRDDRLAGDDAGWASTAAQQ